MRAELAILLVLVSVGVMPGTAAAIPVSGPHETIDNRYTTTHPNAPSGFNFDATYHAAGDPSGDPPYMRRMVSYSPPGLRYDTSVPDRCSASDLELATFGAAACPPGSRIGGGTTVTTFMGSPPSTTPLDVFNNAGEQIILVRSPLVSSVARGRIHADGTVEFASPTCFPYHQPPGCPVDSVLQLQSSIAVAPYTRRINGTVRSYLTTPPTCPAGGQWQTPIRLFWADGSVDLVVTRQPCARHSVHSHTHSKKARKQRRRRA